MSVPHDHDSDNHPGQSPHGSHLREHSISRDLRGSAQVEVEADPEGLAYREALHAKVRQEEVQAEIKAEATRQARHQREAKARLAFANRRRARNRPLVRTEKQLAEQAEFDRRWDPSSPESRKREEQRAEADRIAQAERDQKNWARAETLVVGIDAAMARGRARNQEEERVRVEAAMAEVEEARARGRAAAIEVLGNMPPTPPAYRPVSERLAAWEEAKREPRAKPKSRSLSVETLHWKARMLEPDDWPAQAVASRELGEILLTDHKAAHRLATEQEHWPPSFEGSTIGSRLLRTPATSKAR